MHRQNIGWICAEDRLAHILGEHRDAHQQELASPQGIEARGGPRFVDQADRRGAAKSDMGEVAAVADRTIDLDTAGVVGRVHVGGEHAESLVPDVFHQDLQLKGLAGRDGFNRIAVQIHSLQAEPYQLLLHDQADVLGPGVARRVGGHDPEGLWPHLGVVGVQLNCPVEALIVAPAGALLSE